MVVLISRELGPEGRGVIGLFMSSVALIQMFCDFGNSSAIINLSYTHSVKNIRFSALVWIAGVCLASYPVLYVFFSEIPFVSLIPPAAFLLSWYNLQNLLLMGQRKVHSRNLNLVLLPVLLIIFFVTALQLHGKQTDSYLLAWFPAVAATLFSGAAKMGKISSGTQEKLRFEPEILKNGAWVQSAQSIQFLNYRLNFFLVAYFIGEAALGVFNNAVIISESVWILGHSAGQMLHMNILNTTDEKKHLSLTRKMTLYNLTGSAILCLVLLAIPTDFYITIFGTGFEGMGALFPWLIPGVICFSVSNIINHFMHAKGMFRQILLCNAFGLLTGLVSSLVLIPSNGLSGAALAWSAGLFASLLFYLFRFQIISNQITRKA